MRGNDEMHAPLHGRKMLLGRDTKETKRYGIRCLTLRRLKNENLTWLLTRHLCLCSSSSSSSCKVVMRERVRVRSGS